MSASKQLLLVLVIAAAIAGGAGSIYYFKQSETLTAQVNSLRSDNRELGDALAALETRSTKLEAEKSQAEGHSRELQTKLSETSSRVDVVAGDLQKLKTKLGETVQALNTEQERARTQEKTNAKLQAELAGVSKELAAKQNALKQVSQTHQSLVRELKNEIAQNEIKITRLGDSLSVRMVGNILFPTGQATLTPEGLEVLQRVGDIIVKVTDKRVRVEGHTDNLPISYPLSQTFPTNWELSTARATNVVHFLVDKIGIPPERIEAVGMSEFHPVADNETPEGRSKNRRIEILLTPSLPAKDTE